MVQTSTVAAIRYGYGLHPAQRPPADAAALIESLRNPARRAGARVASTKNRLTAGAAFREANRAARNSRDDQSGAVQAARRAIRQIAADDFRAIVARPVGSAHGFYERLVSFWTDHFTVAANGPILLALAPDMIETAIRPHVTGRFDDLLAAAAQHPAMLAYLNQAQSVGPNSPAGQRRDRGLNENLAREVMELHTLGVDGPYTQADVTELARLMTGLTLDKNGFRFRAMMSEPGQMTVLGRAYHGGRRSLAQTRVLLADLALHPATARHLAGKLVTHFIGSGATDADHIDRMARAYLAADGDLMAMYTALLDHPAALAPPFAKAKWPLDFVVSALRAAGAQTGHITDISPAEFRRGILMPLAAMGQPLLRPRGPDGWAEAAEDWITPSGLATRIRWAGGLAEKLLADRDPAGFVDAALGDAASPLLRAAVAGAETRVEGAALALASPEFNRR